MKKKQIVEIFNDEVPDNKLKHEASRKMALLSLEQVYDIYNFKNEKGKSLIRFISDEQLKKWAFISYPITKEQFDELFPSYAHIKGMDLEKKRELSRLKLVPATQYIAIKKYFDDERISYLGLMS